MSKIRKALLVGSSFSAAPIYSAIKKQGIHVSVCGKIESDPCHQYADASFYIDYSNPEELQRVVESEKFDFLVPSCNDYAYMSCATIAEKYGFPGFDSLEVASILHTKSKFRQVVDRLGLPAPSYTLLRKEELDLNSASISFPLLVKPVDSFSGRGMTKVTDKSALPQAIDNALNASREARSIVLEQFVEGALHSHSAFIQNGEIYLDFFVDEFCTVYPYQVNCSNHPSSLKESVRTSVRSSVNKLVAELNLVDGLLHTQFISNGRDFWIIETMRRCPGDLYGNLIGLSTGVEYADLFARPFLSQKFPLDLLKKPIKFFGRHTISVSESLINFSFSHNIPAANVDIVPLKTSGEKLDIAPFDKLAILFAEFTDPEAMHNTTPHLDEHIHIRKHEE